MGITLLCPVTLKDPIVKATQETTRKQVKDKYHRMDQNKLRTLIFKLFKQRFYWSKVDLVRTTQQPEVSGVRSFYHHSSRHG